MFVSLSQESLEVPDPGLHGGFTHEVWRTHAPSIFCLITLLGMSFIAKSKESTTFFYKGPDTNIFRLVAHKVSIVTTQCCHCRVKAAVNSK